MRRSDLEAISFAWELLPGEEINECHDCAPIRRVVEADTAARYGLILREWHAPHCPAIQTPSI